MNASRSQYTIDNTRPDAEFCILAAKKIDIRYHIYISISYLTWCDSGLENPWSWWDERAPSGWKQEKEIVIPTIFLVVSCLSPCLCMMLVVCFVRPGSGEWSVVNDGAGARQRRPEEGHRGDTAHCSYHQQGGCQPGPTLQTSARRSDNSAVPVVTSCRQSLTNARHRGSELIHKTLVLKVHK